MKRLTVFRLTVGQITAVTLVLIYLFIPFVSRSQMTIAHALKHLGVPYVFNTDSETEMDCSGLIRHVYAELGIEIDHSAEIIGANPDYLTIPSRWLLLPGDIVCFDTVDDSDPSDHVGIYLGGNMFVHASSSYKEVTISELSGFYAEKYTFAKRILCPWS